MSRSVTLLAALAATFAPVGAQTTHRPQYSGVVSEAFGPGEDLTYTVRYGFIKGGEGRFSVRDTVIDGRHVNHVVCGGRTTGVADVFYKVRDSYESYMDRQTQLPLMSKRNIREGRYKYCDKVVYDRHNGQMLKVVKRRDKPEETSRVAMPDRLVDIVGAFYHARNNAFDSRLTPGDTVFYQTFFSDEIYPLNIRYDGIETLNTVMGEKRCYKFTPVTEVGRSFKNKDDMHLWITADANRLPVKIQFDMTVGSFVCELTKATGLRH